MTTQPNNNPQRNVIEIVRDYYHHRLGYTLRVIDENGNRNLTLRGFPVSFPKAIEIIVGLPPTIYRRGSFIDIRINHTVKEEEDAFLAVIRKLEKMTNESAIYKQEGARAESL